MKDPLLFIVYLISLHQTSLNAAFIMLTIFSQAYKRDIVCYNHNLMHHMPEKRVCSLKVWRKYN